MTLLPLSPPNKSLSKSFTTKQEKNAHDSRSTKVRSKTHMMDDDSKKAPSKGQNERTKLNPNMIQQAQKKNKKKVLNQNYMIQETSSQVKQRA